MPTLLFTEQDTVARLGSIHRLRVGKAVYMHSPAFALAIMEQGLRSTKARADHNVFQ